MTTAGRRVKAQDARTSSPRFGNAQKATALVPLAFLSAAWTANLVGVGGALSAEDSPLPDGSMVPIEALEDPATYSVSGNAGLGIAEGDGAKIVAASSTNGIPTAALAAYQRAETVINAADKACHIDWALIAAIGRVESDHGRYGGNTLDTLGVSHPGIYGIALDGTHNTQAISDTDAGQYDRDKVWDRAVGAMQFIPSTWSVVGVDADGDGKRNPQDIDDAALAAAVYLCSGNDDLGGETGRRTAVFRYNHSQEYVDLVLKIRDAYLQGDYTAVPNYLASAYTFSPPTSYTQGGGRGGKGASSTKAGGTGTGKTGSATGPVTSAGSSGGSSGAGVTTGSGSQSGGGSAGGSSSTTGALTEAISKTTQSVDKVLEPVTGTSSGVGAVVESTVNGTLSLVEATASCTTKGYNLLLTPVQWNACMATYGN
ncbi:lytic transglycosylase domain-containing protein [Nocardioides cavernaquae]|uniref:Transglycosylase SLT domain-containing protein n=1 Tax=Nocardioides cavernaquae TaxID=2321396 RepID=A0A3A5H7X1_9ACTN|nr:lytic murein transglycosylase [Nocardioides cavernaquae]RJS46753.1 hypothetical protein D4739_11355 [Nocardioides cavernaquae]